MPGNFVYTGSYGRAFVRSGRQEECGNGMIQDQNNNMPTSKASESSGCFPVI